jgi:hypothetical protein
MEKGPLCETLGLTQISAQRPFAEHPLAPLKRGRDQGVVMARLEGHYYQAEARVGDQRLRVVEGGDPE